MPLLPSSEYEFDDKSLAKVMKEQEQKIIILEKENQILRERVLELEFNNIKNEIDNLRNCL